MSTGSQKSCSQCGAQSKLSNLYGFVFCVRCESKLGLHSDKTILKNADGYATSKPVSYEEEVVERLQKMDRDFIKAKVKLMHILERLGELT